MKFKYIKEKGFTLIELLVVIAIIGALSSVILASLSATRVKAKNNRQQQIAYEYIKAFNLLVTDIGYFPYVASETCLGVGYSGGTCGDFVAFPESATLQSLLDPYITPVVQEDEGYSCSGSTCYIRGFLYDCNAGSPTEGCSEPRIVWGLKGLDHDNQDCLSTDGDGVAIFLGDTLCSYPLSY